MHDSSLYLSLRVTMATGNFQSAPGLMEVAHSGQTTEKLVNSYSEYFKGENSLEERESNATQVTETFYELVTDFYEYGYGQSFHYAPLWNDKENRESIAMFESEIGRQLNIRPGDTVLVSQFLN